MAVDGVLDGVGNFWGLATLGQFDLTGSALATVWLWLRVFLSMAAVGVICFLIYQRYIKNNLSVTVYRRIGSDSYSVIKDVAHAKELPGDGGRRVVLARLRFAGKKVTGPLPDSSFKTKWGKRDHYTFLMDENGLLHPMRAMIDGDSEALIKLFPEDMRWWARREDKRRLERFQTQSKLQFYLPSIIVIVAIGAATMMMYFAFQYIGQQLGNLASQFAQVAASCIELKP